MNLPALISLGTTLFFGITTIWYFHKVEQSRKLLLEKEEKQRQRLTQFSILSEIQNKVGYSLEVEKILSVIVGSIKNLLPYTTITATFLSPTSSTITTHTEEAVSHAYIADLISKIKQSLSLYGSIISADTIEKTTGILLDDSKKEQIGSYFHMPLVVNNAVVGLITITSSKKNSYSLETMTLAYQILEYASNALTRLEKVLASEKGKLLSMIGSLADGVFMVDTTRTITVINQAASRLLGISKENPSVVDVFSSFPKEYTLSEEIDSAISEKKSILKKEIPLSDKTVQIVITPVFGGSNEGEIEVIGASVLLHDITLEKNLAQMKEDFTNMMVHELRSPLTAIKGASELLKTNKGTLSSEQEEKMIGIIEQQSKRLLDQVGSILDAAKLEAGRFIIEKTPGDIGKIIQEKVDLFASPAQAKQITIKASLPSPIPPFAFDQIRIGQVINNLISNSLKFTPEGGTIQVAAYIQSPFVVLSVSDNGIGIPQDKLSSLFSKFTQVSHDSHDTSKQHASGTGLGLYIVKGIVEAHKGTISVSSHPNEGTTFNITLPFVQQPLVNTISPHHI